MDSKGRGPEKKAEIRNNKMKEYKMLKRQKDREEENPRENETRPRRVAVLAND